MNKLLIICDMFPPAFAPRMGYLCKYLTRMGWEVTVVTEYIEDNTFEFLTGYADVYCVRYYKASGKISKHIEWMWVMFLDILFGYKDMKIINACIPLIKTNQYKGKYRKDDCCCQEVIYWLISVHYLTVVNCFYDSDNACYKRQIQSD